VSLSVQEVIHVLRQELPVSVSVQLTSKQAHREMSGPVRGIEQWQVVTLLRQIFYFYSATFVYLFSVSVNISVFVV
jgi:hypothetical protein